MRGSGKINITKGFFNLIKMIKVFLKKYSHVNWALADQSVVSGSNFLTGILLARYLGLEEFGIFSLVWTAVLFVNSLQMSMIISPMMSIGSKKSNEESPYYFGAVFLQQLIFSIISFVILFLAVKYSGKIFPHWGIKNLALPLASVTLAFQLQDFMRRYFFLRNRAKAAFISDCIRYFIQLIMLIWFFQIIKLDSAASLWIIASASLISIIIGFFFLDALIIKLDVVISVTKQHFFFSNWLVGSSILQWVSGNLFIIVAGISLGPIAVGALKAVQNIMGLTHILFQAFENFVPVRAGSHYVQGGLDALVTYLYKVAFSISFITAAIVILFIIFPEFWLDLFYGEEYLPYAYLVSWFAIAYFIVSLALPLRYGLRTIERTKEIFFSNLAGTLITVLFIFPLINNFGIIGAPLTLVSSQLIMTSTLFMFSHKIYFRIKK